MLSAQPKVNQKRSPTYDVRQSQNTLIAKLGMKNIHQRKRNQHRHKYPARLNAAYKDYGAQINESHPSNPNLKPELLRHDVFDESHTSFTAPFFSLVKCVISLVMSRRSLCGRCIFSPIFSVLILVLGNAIRGIMAAGVVAESRHNLSGI